MKAHRLCKAMTRLPGAGNEIIYDENKPIPSSLPVWCGQSNRWRVHMLTHLICLTALALLCGFAWHNQSARQPIRLKAEAKRENGPPVEALRV